MIHLIKSASIRWKRLRGWKLLVRVGGVSLVLVCLWLALYPTDTHTRNHRMLDYPDLRFHIPFTASKSDPDPSIFLSRPHPVQEPDKMGALDDIRPKLHRNRPFFQEKRLNIPEDYGERGESEYIHDEPEEKKGYEEENNMAIEEEEEEERKQYDKDIVAEKDGDEGKKEEKNKDLEEEKKGKKKTEEEHNMAIEIDGQEEDKYIYDEEEEEGDEEGEKYNNAALEEEDDLEKIKYNENIPVEEEEEAEKKKNEEGKAEYIDGDKMDIAIQGNLKSDRNKAEKVLAKRKMADQELNDFDQSLNFADDDDQEKKMQRSLKIAKEKENTKTSQKFSLEKGTLDMKPEWNQEKKNTELKQYGLHKREVLMEAEEINQSSNTEKENPEIKALNTDKSFGNIEQEIEEQKSRALQFDNNFIEQKIEKQHGKWHKKPKRKKNSSGKKGRKMDNKHGNIKEVEERKDKKFGRMEREMEERKARVREVCRRYGLGPNASPSKTPALKHPPTPNYDIFYIDRTDGLAWCPVYKAASTSWLYTFLKLAGISEAYVRNTHKQVSHVARGVWPALEYFEAEKAIDKCLKFLIVRHPFERLVSAYRDKLENTNIGKEHGVEHFYKTYGKKIVSRYRKGGEKGELPSLRYSQDMDDPSIPKPRGIEPTFPEFIRYLIDTDLVYYSDDHWMPYYLHCTPCLVDYDVIAKFETLERDQNYIVHKAGLEHKVKPTWKHLTKGKKTSDTVKKYFATITKTELIKLFGKYKLDFELFGYSVDEYLDYVMPG